MHAIDFLDEIPDHHKGNLIENTDLSKNYLSSIDVLNRFVNLKEINASDNYLASINFALPHLKKLILKNNFFKKIPNFSLFPELAQIDLSANQV